jgi:hypothetical protein
MQHSTFDDRLLWFGDKTSGFVGYVGEAGQPIFGAAP